MSAKRGMSGRLIAALLCEEAANRMNMAYGVYHWYDYLAFLRSVATHTGKSRTKVTRAYADAVRQIEGR